MILLYIIGCLIVFGLVIIILNAKKKNNSPYLQVKKKLEDDLQQANFTGDWRKRQEINLHLIWLKTLNEVDMSRETSLLANLSFDQIKFPLKWKLDDIYSFTFFDEILSAYGKVIAKNAYGGLCKPDSILPVPKNYIRKAILFNFDYLIIEKTIYKVPDKDKYAEILGSGQVQLELWFIDTGNDDLPQGFVHDITDKTFLEKLGEREVEVLKLIDWRTEREWFLNGVHHMRNNHFDHAVACFEQVKKLNPEHKDLEKALYLAYYNKGVKHYEKGKPITAIENIRKSAALGYEVAINWLRQHQEN